MSRGPFRRARFGALLCLISLAANPAAAQGVSVMGRVQTQPALGDYEDIQVFIPGTSYISRTDRAGNFVLSNVPAGHHRITASTEPSRLATVGRVRTEIDVRPGMGPVVLTLRPLVPVVQDVSPRSITPTSGLAVSGSEFGFSEGQGCETYLDNQLIAAQSGTAWMAPYERVSDTYFKVKGSFFADLVKAAPNSEHRVAVKCRGKYIDLGTVKYVLPDTAKGDRPTTSRKGRLG